MEFFCSISLSGSIVAVFSAVTPTPSNMMHSTVCASNWAFLFEVWIIVCINCFCPAMWTVRLKKALPMKLWRENVCEFMCVKPWISAATVTFFLMHLFLSWKLVYSENRNKKRDSTKNEHSLILSGTSMWIEQTLKMVEYFSIISKWMQFCVTQSRLSKAQNWVHFGKSDWIVNQKRRFYAKWIYCEREIWWNHMKRRIVFVSIF